MRADTVASPASCWGRYPPTSASADVVADIDAWPDSERVVRLAADEALRLGRRLVLVHG